MRILTQRRKKNKSLAIDKKFLQFKIIENFLGGFILINYNGLYNKDFYGDNLQQVHYFSDKKLHFRIIENGTVLPTKGRLADFPHLLGGIIDNKNNYIAESHVSELDDGAYTPTAEIPNDPSTVIFIGMLPNVWGHCITDDLKRIWFLKSDIYKKYLKNCKVIYCAYANGEFSPQFAKLLSILEIDVNNWYKITEPIRFQNIILPDVSFKHAMVSGGGIFV